MMNFSTSTTLTNGMIVCHYNNDHLDVTLEAWLDEEDTFPYFLYGTIDGKEVSNGAVLVAEGNKICNLVEYAKAGDGLKLLAEIVLRDFDECI